MVTLEGAAGSVRVLVVWAAPDPTAFVAVTETLYSVPGDTPLIEQLSVDAPVEQLAPPGCTVAV